MTESVPPDLMVETTEKAPEGEPSKLVVRSLRQDAWRVPQVGRWGYAFYPLHLLAIKALQALT
mgnify:CR=1 FL=1